MEPLTSTDEGVKAENGRVASPEGERLFSTLFNIMQSHIFSSVGHMIMLKILTVIYLSTPFILYWCWI